MDVKVFSSVAGVVGGELVKLSGGVICSDCCVLMMNSSATNRLQADVGQSRPNGKLHFVICF